MKIRVLIIASIGWFTLSFCVFFGILLLSTALSVPIQLEGIGYLDKMEHAFAYFALITSLLFGFHRIGFLNSRIWLALIAFCSLYGMGLEWIQYTFFPNRYFEWLDVVANVTGVFLGSLVFRLFKKRFF